MTLDVLLFDLDGTLTDPKPGITGCIRFALDQLGVSCPGDDALVTFIGPPLRDTFATLLDTLETARIEEAMGLYRQRFAATGLYENQVYAGVPAMLEHCQQASPAMYVATSKPAVYAKRIVRHFGLDQHFRQVYGAELDGRREDKADLVAYLLASEGVGAQTAVMIGDRAADVRAAKANGVRSIGVLWGYGSAHELLDAGVDTLCRTPSELAAHLSGTQSELTVPRNQVLTRRLSGRNLIKGRRPQPSQEMRTVRTLLLLSFLMIIAAPQCIRAQTPAGPTLLTEQNSQRAIALDSVTRVRDPLPVVALNNFQQGRDPRTRVALFGINLDLMPGENASAVTAQARDSRSRNYSLKVEFVGKVPTFDWLTQVVVRLPDELAQAGDVWISVNLHGQTSNEVLFGIKVQSEPGRVTLPARRITNGQDNYVDATFSFEFGMNGVGAVSLTRNDWDILFGNSPSRDTFGVTMVTDDCSRIRDLGALNWGDTFQVPVLQAYPVPTSEPAVDAIVGHMYVVHTKDTQTDLYSLFRVEALDPLKSVTISWKGVQRPFGD